MHSINIHWIERPCITYGTLPYGNENISFTYRQVYHYVGDLRLHKGIESLMHIWYHVLKDPVTPAFLKETSLWCFAHRTCLTYPWAHSITEEENNKNPDSTALREEIRCNFVFLAESYIIPTPTHGCTTLKCFAVPP